MFMHANVIHLIGNMWFLLIFGRNVSATRRERRSVRKSGRRGIRAGLRVPTVFGL